MGASFRFNLNEFIKKYDLDNYIETGFGKLDSFNFALTCNFKQWFGVDLDKDLYDQAYSQLKDNVNVLLVNNYSTEFLKLIAPEVIGNSLWFIDSHFPGKCDFGGISQAESLQTYKEHSLPLIEELKTLTNNKDTSKDLIIIDDLCLYVHNIEHESAQVGCVWQYSQLQKELGLDTNLEEILSYFPDRKYEIDLRDQGYLLVLPNEI